MTKKPVDTQIGLSLSGGGSRAMAFHLGCLRALHERDLLQNISVISCVSGGSVIGAMYAYSNDSFADFEKRVIETLRIGFARKALVRWLCGRFILGLMNLVAITVAIGINSIFRTKLSVRKRFSRAECFEQTIGRMLFPKCTLNAPTRDNVQIIFNACELQSKTAFRFSNVGVTCWKFGDISADVIPVSTAVAASAAYPLFLPAIERCFEFHTSRGKETRTVVLTDGGIYENQGVTSLFPGRSDSHGLKVNRSNFIISCDAGNGSAIESLPNQWVGNRLYHCFDSIMRRSQAFNFKLLFDFKASQAIDGFILAYLAQDDGRLEPLDFEFTTRKAVGSYGTNFSAMSDEDIERISRRGQDVMSNLLLRYYPF